MDSKYVEVESFSIGADNDIEVKVPRSKIRQYVAALLANLASLCTGVAMGWTAPALPLIQRENNVTLTLYATEVEASWISGLLPIGALVGALPAGYLADRLGRRKVLLAMAVPYFLGWLLIILADDSVVQVYLGRFVSGLAVGACTVLVPLYNEEIAEDSIRGALGAYLDFMICVGILWIYVLGAVLPYMWYTILSSILPVIFAVTFFWMPESPTYLVAKDLIPEAEKSLMWFRNGGRQYDIQPELQRLVITFETTDKNYSSRPLMVVLKKFCFRSTTLKAVAIIFGLMFFQQLSGINAVIFYTVQIFNDAGSSLPADVCTIIIGVVQVIATFGSSVTVDHLGRRPLLLMSSVIMSICLASMSGYFYCKVNSFDLESWRWLPLVSLVIYVVVFALGFGPLPWFMMAELLPSSAKGWASAGAVSLNWTIAVLVTKLFPDMLRQIGQDVTYGILCCLCIAGGVFVAFAVPETKGKSREEIQQSLESKKE